MKIVILLLFIMMIVLLNIIFFRLQKKEKLHIAVAGLIMIIFAPVFNYLSNYLFSKLGRGDAELLGIDTTYIGIAIGLLTMVNGVIFLLIGTYKKVAAVLRNYKHRDR